MNDRCSMKMLRCKLCHAGSSDRLISFVKNSLAKTSAIEGSKFSGRSTPPELLSTPILFLDWAGRFAPIHLSGLRIDDGAAAALVALGGDNLVVMVAEPHANIGPSVEMVLHSDGAANTLLGADRPVLVESLRAVDGRLVVAGRLVQVVGTSISVDSTSVLSSAGWVVRAVRLNNVVLNEWVASPAIDSKIAVTTGLE
jgi:hypothetical protein